MRASFCDTESWCTSYQRNNKGGGLKNLRCFPFCKDVHVDRGYCGAPVTVELSSETEPSGKIFVLAAFRTLVPEVIDLIEEDGDESSPTEVMDKMTSSTKHFQVGEKIKLPHLFDLVSENVIPKRFFKGDVEHSGAKNIKKVVFNSDNKGWNYSWRGTKHTSRTEHCFTVYVCEQINESEAEVVEIVDSPTFMVFSRKKKRLRNYHQLANWKRSRVSHIPGSYPQSVPTNQEMLFPLGNLSGQAQMQPQALQQMSQLNALAQYYHQVALVQSLVSGNNQGFIQPVQGNVLPQISGSVAGFPLQNQIVMGNLFGQNLNNFQSNGTQK